MAVFHYASTIHFFALRLFLLSSALIALLGCTTTHSRESIPPFRQAVIAADQQSSAAFTDVNAFLRRQQVEYALRQDALSDDLFFVALASTDLAQWSRGFALMDSYAEKLELLLDPEKRFGLQGEFSELGERIGAMRGEELPAGTSAAFMNLGGLLIQLKGERDALEAMRKADPVIQEIFGAMMEAIGADSESGVRGTVWACWTQILARIDVVSFRSASTDKAKRAAVHNYIEALDERDLQDRMLGSLRLSLVMLAKAHQELAEGRRMSAKAMLRLVQDEHKMFREQLKTFRERRQGEPTEGGTV
jgi:hypothetical protein